MNRRRFVVGGSASAVALTMAGLAAQRAANAQDATPTPSTGTETTPSDAQTRYQEFVAALATNLGVADAATVDSAIRTSLKQLVDAEFAAGNISANDATARKERIDAADSPLGGFGGFGGHDGRGGRRGPNDDRGIGGDKSDGTDDGTEPETEATPDAL